MNEPQTFELSVWADGVVTTNEPVEADTEEQA